MRTVCGTDCAACRFRERFSCPGCRAVSGKPFWGECRLFACAREKGHEHCGNCAGFPCEALKDAIANGHQPHRMENLLQWRQEDASAK